ncbi:hypothetical protein [Enterococcus termitis]|uniref:Phage protein n=1 Tax=Enterococcus termitis TaxID=332950 RepID=A0A1E5GIG0_9ENTE|nr:hypothetical protein [Enterococcus termitis]OEG12467.1 hypothetical protein BCR25_07985 [Enterococcus termitis]OJG96681.1 hypothetical protein RV18_GL001967 [Enterococcus termitis]
MSYLEFSEFQELTGKTEDFKELFEKYLIKAEAVLDHETQDFYQFNDIKTDEVTFRVNKFKKALCAQIIYFGDLNADTFENLNSQPQMFTIGSTTVSNVSRYNAGGSNESKSLVAEDVYLYLEGTGLLYRGVPSC